MSFSAPALLALLPALVVLLIVSVHLGWKRTRGLADYLDGARETGFWPEPPSHLPLPSAWRVRGLLLGIAAFALVLASAGPRAGTREVPVLQGQIPLVLVVDVSRSMSVEDVPWGRLGSARLLAHRVAQALPAAPLALTVFAEESYPLLPPSMDRDLLFTYLDALDPSMVTLQGTGLAAALESVSRPADPETPVLLVLTDGESSDHLEALRDAAASIRDAGGAVAAVSFGTEAGGPVPGLVPLSAGGRSHPDSPETLPRPASTGPPISRARPDVLRQLADAGGGGFADARDPGQVRTLLDWLRSRLGGAESGTVRPEPVDRWPWFAALALTALLAEAALSGARRPEGKDSR